MAGPHNVTIKRYISDMWETIYPKTVAANVISGEFHVDRIPNLDADKIASGILNVARIPDLAASKINSGVFDDARIPNLDASKINSGVFDVARLPAIALTNALTATTLASFVSIYASDISVMQAGDILILTTDKKTYIHNGGSTGTASDFTLLQTPTDAVASVAGKTGVVTLVKADVGLGNVDNTSDINKPISAAVDLALATKATKASILAGTKTKITFNADGIVTGGADLVAGDIPSLDASKINSGTFAEARVPALPVSKITNLQNYLDGKQESIAVVADSLLSSMSPAAGTIVFAT